MQPAKLFFIWPSPSIQTWYVLMYWSTVYTCNVIDVISHKSMSSRTFGAVFPKETSSLLWYVSPSNFATLNAWLRSVCGMERVPALCAESTWSSDHRKAVAGIRLTVSSALLVVSIDDLLQLNVESWTLVVSLSFCDWIWTHSSAQCLKCVSVFFGPYKNARDSPTCVLKTCLIWCCFDSPGSAFYICWTKIVCCKSRTGRAETGACICIYIYMWVLIYIYVFIYMYVSMYVCIYVSMYICNYVYMYLFIYVYMYIGIYAYMYICIYVGMYICTFVKIVCLYICIYVSMYICIHVYMYVCMYVCIYVFMYACMYVCIFICVYFYMYIYICIFLYIFIYVNRCLYMYICLYIYIHLCVYLCIFMYICIYVIM